MRPDDVLMRPHTLVVGGTRGIGRAVVGLLADEGHAVSVIGRHAPSAEDAAARADVEYVVADVADEAALPDVLSTLVLKRGELRNLVFMQRYRGAGDPWTGEIATGLAATKNVIELLKDSFVPGADNSIVAISSVASALVATEQSAGYHVAKAGLVHLVHYYALVLAPRGIRVNAVSFGTVLKDEARQFYADNQPLTDLYRQVIPLGRMGTAVEVSGVISFLCSSKSSFMTGQNLVVDGGVSLQWQESLARRVTGLDHIRVTRPPDGSEPRQ
jgi:NAD(P)-dependent dehydrogenase (short-subunit alcohol dehydrogenase family)